MKTKAIAAITIKLPGQTIELTPGQARALHKELNQLFDSEVSLRDMVEDAIKTSPRKEYVTVPYPTYPQTPLQPIWVMPQSPTWNPGWTTICSTPVDSIGSACDNSMPHTLSISIGN